MKLARGHVLAYLLGISSNVWAAFFVDLPAKVRVWVEASFLAVPIVVVASCFYPTFRGWAIQRARDFQRTLAWLLMMVIAFLWMLDMRRRGIPPDQIGLYMLVGFLLLAFLSYRPKVHSAS